MQPALLHLHDSVGALQAALEDKQRLLQALRLRASFASLHELRLEQQLRASRIVGLQRRLARQNPALHAALAPLVQREAQLRGACGAAANAHADFGEHAHHGWAAIDGAAASLPDAVGGLLAAGVAAEEERDDGADIIAREAQERAELERKKQGAEEELRRLRAGHDASDAVERSVEALMDESAGLRERRATLQSQVAVLRRQVAAA